MIDFEALFRLSYGIYIISSHGNDTLGGCLVNTVFQLTAEPVRIGVSVAKANQTHDLITAGGTLAVTVVTQEAEDKLLGKFGYRTGREIEKFAAGEPYHFDEHGDPVLDRFAAAYLSCTVEKTVDLDTHSVFICRVDSAVKAGDAPVMTYEYYRNVKKLKSSRYAPTWVKP